MPKYTKEFKIKLVLEYLSGKSGGQETVAKKYNVPYSTLRNWINKYKSGGFDNLSKKLKNNKYTSEFKLSVIQYRQINNTSLRETAEHFNLVNGSMVYRWKRCYFVVIKICIVGAFTKERLTRTGLVDHAITI